MRATATSLAIAASLATGLVAEASAAGFQLSAAPEAGHYVVTLQVGSLADLQAMLESEALYNKEDADTGFDQAIRAAGFAFSYSGGWASSPLIMGQSHTVAEAGLESLGESADSGQPFSFDYRYVQQRTLSDGYKLLSFALWAPQGAGGQIDLVSAKLNPITRDLNANTLATGQSLASLTITNAVPEPTAFVLMALGLAGLGLARRTRQG